MDAMNFLLEHIKPRTTRSYEMPALNPSTSELSEDVTETVEPSRKKRKLEDDSFTSPNNKIEETCFQIGTAISTTGSTSLEQNFGQIIVALLQDLPTQQKNASMSEVFNVVMKYCSNME